MVTSALTNAWRTWACARHPHLFDVKPPATATLQPFLTAIPRPLASPSASALVPPAGLCGQGCPAPPLPVAPSVLLATETQPHTQRKALRTPPVEKPDILPHVSPTTFYVVFPSQPALLTRQNPPRSDVIPPPSTQANIPPTTHSTDTRTRTSLGRPPTAEPCYKPTSNHPA